MTGVDLLAGGSISNYVIFTSGEGSRLESLNQKRELAGLQMGKAWNTIDFR